MQRADSFEKTLMLERLRAGGEGDNRGWDGKLMASPTWWTRVWVNSGSWWWIGRPGVLRFMGSQMVRDDWATDLSWAISLYGWARRLEMDPHPVAQIFEFCLNKPWILLILDEIFWQHGPRIKALFSLRYAYSHLPHCSSWASLVIWEAKQRKSKVWD